MKYIPVIITIFLVLVITPNTFAHSGRTDSNGGHNCSDSSIAKGLCTGYHFHNSGSVTPPADTPAPKVIAPEPVAIPTPTKTPRPTIKPTFKPTTKPTSTPSPELSPSPSVSPSAEISPSPIGEVKAIQTEQIQEVKKSVGFFEWLFSLFK